MTILSDMERLSSGKNNSVIRWNNG